MPELPEIHTIVTDLHKHISGYQITGIHVAKGYSTLPNNNTFIKETLGRKVIGVSRIAKNILIELENQKYVHMHLAMTGQVLLHDTKQVNKWTKVVLDLGSIEKGNSQVPQKFLSFSDMRIFGKVGLLNEKELETLHEKYGPEPLDKKVTAEEFFKKLKSKRTTIKNALLDQEIVAGLGNIYATDALFLAKIHPESLTTKLTLEHATKLLRAAEEVLNEGIINRGSTLADKMYVDIFGRPGSQQNHFKIYSKKKCAVCGSKVEFKKISGRGTYFCPTCQVLL